MSKSALEPLDNYAKWTYIVRYAVSDISYCYFEEKTFMFQDDDCGGGRAEEEGEGGEDGRDRGIS